MNDPLAGPWRLPSAWEREAIGDDHESDEPTDKQRLDYLERAQGITREAIDGAIEAEKQASGSEA